MLARATRSLGKKALISSTRTIVPTLVTGQRNISLNKSPYKHGHHRSNAEELISKVPVIEVDGDVAVCDGGSGALGHPLEYIQLHTVKGKPQSCKYCGLRYVAKGHGHHH